MQTVQFEVTPQPPYSLPLILERLTRYPEVVDRVDAEGCYRRLLHIDGEVTLIEVRQEGSPSRARLRVRLRGERVRRVGARRAAERFVARVLAADSDLRSFYRAFRDDEILGRPIREHRGLRVVGSASLFESILTAILAQQVNLTFAYSIRKALAERFGERLEIGAEEYIAFPTAIRLAAVRESQLRGFKLSGAKAAAIRAVARAFACGELDEEELDALEDDEVVERLVVYRGIGRWTAEIALLRGLSRPDVFPAGDLTVVKYLAQGLLGHTEKASEAAMREFSERWRPHRSLALVYAYAELGRRKREE
jgi:DNA-3-methyladenine glycosylase II